MSDIIATDFQTQEIDSPVIDLFELTLPSGSVVYFHPGKDDNLDDVIFKDKVADGSGNYAERTYTSIPVAIDGLEMQADGATSRPTISIANIGTTVLTGDDTLAYDDLIGQDITRRQTLEKYLKGGSAYNSATTSPPVELNSVKYKIDRIASENNIGVIFELAVPYDLEGIQLPRRQVVGKFCSWMYQGYHTSGKGGCTAPLDGNFTYISNAGGLSNAVLFSDIDNNFFVDSGDLTISSLTAWSSNSASYTPTSYVKHPGNTRAWVATNDHTSTAQREPGTTGGSSFWKELKLYTAYNSSTSYSVGALVKHNITISGATVTAIFECLIANTSSTPNRTPSLDNAYWTRVDLCGKTLANCKCKFGTLAKNKSVDGNTLPEGKPHGGYPLPFGAFPGTARF